LLFFSRWRRFARNGSIEEQAWPLTYDQLTAVVHLLETMVPPEEDRDTLSSAERKAIGEADEWLKHNQPIPHEEVLAEFGLTSGNG
jgi:hypothetical protein